MRPAREEELEEGTVNEQGTEAMSPPEGFQEEIRELLDLAVTRKERRDDVISRLTALGPAGVASLCEALGDTRVEIRKAAAEALCRIGDARALGPLLELLCGRSDWASQHLDILCNGEFFGIPGAREGLLRTLRDDPPAHADLLIYGVREGSAIEGTRDSFLAAFRNSALPHSARNAALEALCSHEPTMSTGLVLEALADDTFRRHSGSAWWIAVREGLRLPIQVCLRGFDRSVPASSRRLAGTLVLRHGEDGKGVLRELMSSGSADERATAALVLVSEGGPDVFGVLADELLRGHREGKWTRMMGRALAWKFTEQLLEWGDRLSRGDAQQPGIAWALAKGRLAASRATTDDILLCGAPEQRRSAVRDLVRRKGAASLPVLRHCLREGRPQKVASLAFREIRRMKQAAGPAALEMLESDHWGERKAAVGLLRQWGLLTDEQRAAATQDQHIAVRHAAEGRRP
jgi:hypothetical protein